ncbi:hypothetical protein GOODEAATRI_003235 [Goodea atripinnis]|uniref:Protein UNC80 C-terminal domain-containing protein n=1 Tax=Goodea atripinnis TaxID=208336 RepID=A0ABV0PKE6_9TELE
MDAISATLTFLWEVVGYVEGLFFKDLKQTMKKEQCEVKLLVFTRKLEEVGRVLFLISLTQRMPAVHKQSHVSLLQEDLLRLPSFPRTAIDAEFSLFNEPQGE